MLIHMLMPTAELVAEPAATFPSISASSSVSRCCVTRLYPKLYT
jgi:hypothetical protein